jgi:hypothetical protein
MGGKTLKRRVAENTPKNARGEKVGGAAAKSKRAESRKPEGGDGGGRRKAEECNRKPGNQEGTEDEGGW